MGAFRFRLTTLLRVREATRDERRARLGEAQAAEEKLLGRRRRLEAEIAASEGAHRGQTALGSVDIDRLLNHHRYELLLKAEVQSIDREQAILKQELDKRRLALVAADREVRVLEKLRDKLAERHGQEMSAQAAKEMDELAALHWRQEDD
jgi:flagellar export protein FliJ